MESCFGKGCVMFSHGYSRCSTESTSRLEDRNVLRNQLSCTTLFVVCDLGADWLPPRFEVFSLAGAVVFETAIAW